MTLQDIEREVYRRLNKSTVVPNPETQWRVRNFINGRHRMLLRKFPRLRDDVLQFDTLASQPDYSLPEHGIARINRIWDTENDMTLGMLDLHWYRRYATDPQEGTPEAWVPIGYTQVHTQPSAASEVFVDSTSASDTGRCYVEGMTAGGYRRVVEVTMTGTTGVSVDASILDWIQIDKFYLSTSAVGIVTLHENSEAGNELSRITIGDTYAKYHAFYLYPTPSSVVTYSIDITRAIGDMEKPLDEPLLPIDFHDLLAIGARLDEYEKTDDSRRRMAEVEWDEGVKALTSWMVAHPSERLTLDRNHSSTGMSRLGAWFPNEDFPRFP